jgi:opacity protein-like surface antigen
MRFFPAAYVAAAVLWPAAAFSQAAAPITPYYSRANSFGIFAAYSNDSSHMIMGVAENRKLLSFGASYSRRIWQGRVVNWQYDGEILPVALESDPVIQEATTYTSPVQEKLTATGEPVSTCHAASGSFSQSVGGIVYAGTYSDSCSRRWTIGEGISPVGFQWNFMPKRRVQPILMGHGGYMYSTQAIPVDGSGSFNFTFDFGAGVEWFRANRHSWRAEYRYHHISNHDTANVNPGIDNGVFQLSYVFGR